MLQVDRANYAPVHAYEDSPQPIGHKATISAPHMHAYALEFLLTPALESYAHILDIGWQHYELSMMSRLSFND